MTQRWLTLAVGLVLGAGSMLVGLAQAGRLAPARPDALVVLAQTVEVEHRRIDLLLEREQLRARIEAVLGGMNPRYAEVLRLRLLQGRSRDECAAALEVKIGTLDVLLFRACRAFRQACEKQGVALAGEP